jgi:hypothetical protein
MNDKAPWHTAELVGELAMKREQIRRWWAERARVAW